MARCTPVILAILLLAALGCVQHHHHHAPGPVVVGGHGPPPHAPAHGHRWHHPYGLDLVFDSGLGVYVVVGARDAFYYRDHFYRIYGGYWQASPRFDAGWKVIPTRSLPPGLAKKRWHVKGPLRGKHHPARYGD